MVNQTVMKIEILRCTIQKKIKNLIYGLMTSLMTVKLLWLDALGYIKDKLEPELSLSLTLPHGNLWFLWDDGK